MSVLNTPDDPRHQLPNPMADGWLRYVPLAAVILGFILVSTNYGELPAQIPIHFNGRGEVDGYGPKVMLWLLPVVNLGVFGLMSLIPKTPFSMFNYPVTITEENAARQHRIALDLLAYMRAIVCLLLSYLVFAIVESALAEESRLDMLVMGGFMVALFGVIGWKLKEAFDKK